MREVKFAWHFGRLSIRGSSKLGPNIDIWVTWCIDKRDVRGEIKERTGLVLVKEWEWAFRGDSLAHLYREIHMLGGKRFVEGHVIWEGCGGHWVSKKRRCPEAWMWNFRYRSCFDTTKWVWLWVWTHDCWSWLCFSKALMYLRLLGFHQPYLSQIGLL